MRLMNASTLDILQKIPDFNAPFEVTLHVTNACNLACKHCYARSGSPLPDELTTEEIMDLIDQMSTLRVFYTEVTGGEPLLRKDILEILSYLRDKGFKILFDTNALLVTQKIAKRLKELECIVSVSLDGLAGTHDKIRGNQGIFSETIKGIKKLVDAHNNVQVNFTLTKINRKEISHVIEHAIKLKANGFVVLFCMPAGRASDNIRELRMSLNEWRNTRVILQQIVEKYKDKISISIPIRDFPSTLEFLNESSIVTCPAGKTSCSITANGFVLPCPHFQDFNIFSAGNIREKTFKEIWLSSPILRKFRYFSFKDVKGKCQKCKFKLTCLGGCKFVSFIRYGDIHFPDPRCFYNPKSHPEMFTSNT